MLGSATTTNKPASQRGPRLNHPQGHWDSTELALALGATKNPAGRQNMILAV
jgi:hypothetical protein